MHQKNVIFTLLRIQINNTNDNLLYLTCTYNGISNIFISTDFRRYISILYQYGDNIFSNEVFAKLI